jgi:cytoplasmic iron level regulating protein YaaA (DUF328/UPF0246 family)
MSLLLIVITSCSASKDDSVSIPPNSRIVEPSYYLGNTILVSRLRKKRESIFQDPRARIGQKTTYAFDLYVRAGTAYKDLLKNNYHQLKERLLRRDDIEWFFLSGGYGIIHALEKARKYQATFNRSIACQKDIPYTKETWNSVLTLICEAIFSKFCPDWVYVFGSRDYTQFVKSTNYWKRSSNITMFESTGSAGPNWLSPMLHDLVSSIFGNKVDDFNAKYKRFVKQ